MPVQEVLSSSMGSPASGNQQLFLENRNYTLSTAEAEFDGLTAGFEKIQLPMIRPGFPSSADRIEL